MSTMSHVTHRFEMIARRMTQVVLEVRSQGVQQSKHSNLLQPDWNNDFAGGLRCQTPYEGNDPSFRRFSSIPSRKAIVVAMWDLIRGS